MLCESVCVDVAVSLIVRVTDVVVVHVPDAEVETESESVRVELAD